MEAIRREKVEPALQAFVGRRAYLHLEVAPGGFARNVVLAVEAAFLRGDGPYRVALRSPGTGWVWMEDLTDYAIGPGGELLLAAHDGDGRLTRALELSLAPFPL